MMSRDRLKINGPTALAGFVIALGIALYPVFSHHFVSMNDVYNHVARAAVLARYDDLPALREYWTPNWRLVPYLGYDLVEAWLLSWFSIGFVAKLMVAASIMMLLGGGMILSRVAHGIWSGVALSCALLLFNRTLLAGFINYLFGVGLSLVGASAWIALRERALPVRLVVLAAFATAIYAVHLFACGVLGVIVVGVELSVLLERRVRFLQILVGLAVPAVAFLPVLFLFVFVAPHPEYHAFITYHGLASRLGAFAVPLTYAPIEELVGFLAIGAAVLAFWVTGHVSVDRRLATAAGLLAAVQLIMPAEIGTATVADHRIPIALWMIVLCSIHIYVDTVPLAVGFMLLVAAVFISRVAVVQERWSKENVIYDEAYNDMESLPGTARVAIAYPQSGLNSATRPAVALYYMPAMVFAPKGGFTQIVFAISDQHALVMRPAFKRLTDAAPPDVIWSTFVAPAANGEDAATRARVLAAVASYDYLVFVDAEPFEVGPAKLLEPVRNGPGIRIYRVVHGVGSPGVDAAGR